ncbi:hypothetical protein [Microbacterium sp. Se63.02b]|uniref:glycoside hydrolase family 38 N-terminal domain-containing protein n=1 Tax=Microbacterium sp. Se63.02b TaxID=2709304 RepID=UPI001604B7C7|nr:hypothetical protein [Microbacterium sp. Se63.02b]QNA93739.1 hypothetical protein G4G29_18240 [Microbacterium sp. Se63.02b]
MAAPLDRTPRAIELWHSTWYRELIATSPLAFHERWDKSAVLLGGADFHMRSQGVGPGTPTTWVAAENDSVEAILAGVAAGRTAIMGGVSVRDGLSMPELFTAPVLLRVDGELLAIDADGLILVDGEGSDARCTATAPPSTAIPLPAPTTCCTPTAASPPSAPDRARTSHPEIQESPPVSSEIVVVPHTHWDREWYEPHDVFRLRLVHMLDRLIGILEAEPSYRFTLDGQAAAVDDYLEMRPDMRDRVVALVERGQLSIGPFLILLDEFGCDGETIIRNLELGRAVSARLGRAMPVGYLPDMFGHAAQMPQILAGFGIRHSALWRGVPAGVAEHAFAWVAPNGDAVRCEYLFDGYGNGLDMFALPGQLPALAPDYAERTASWYGDDPVLAMLGTDHSAPPEDLAEVIREYDAAGQEPHLSIATLDEHLARYATDVDTLAALPQVHGEMRSHARGNLLPGVFSIRTNLKREMARSEQALTAAERLDLLYGTRDHRSFFDTAWYRIVESTAHDSVTGCGVDATEQVGTRIHTAGHIARGVIDSVLRDVSAAVSPTRHLVFNPSGFARRAQVEVTLHGVDPGALAPGVQLLDPLPTVLGDERMRTADLPKILRRIHGRELFGQQINGYEWGDGSLRFQVAERAGRVGPGGLHRRAGGARGGGCRGRRPLARRDHRRPAAPRSAGGRRRRTRARRGRRDERCGIRRPRHRDRRGTLQRGADGDREPRRHRPDRGGGRLVDRRRARPHRRGRLRRLVQLRSGRRGLCGVGAVVGRGERGRGGAVARTHPHPSDLRPAGEPRPGPPPLDPHGAAGDRDHDRTARG